MHYVLGLDTLKDALHIYFDRHEWSNTELKDFIGSLQEAYDNSGKHPMGKNFQMSKWSDSWLKTGGIDLLEGIVTYDEN